MTRNTIASMATRRMRATKTIMRTSSVAPQTSNMDPEKKMAAKIIIRIKKPRRTYHFIFGLH